MKTGSDIPRTGKLFAFFAIILCVCLASTALICSCTETGSDKPATGETSDGFDSVTEPSPDTRETESEAAGTPAQTDVKTDGEPDTDPADGDTESTGTDTETEPESQTEEPYTVNNTYAREEAGAASDTVINVADFGAVGDGRTDDGPAICQAMEKAVEAHATLRLEEGKTYYVASSSRSASGFRSPFALSGTSNVTVDGCGATLLFEPGLNYFAMVDCRNILLKNCVFDMATPVYLVGTVTAVDGLTATFSTDREPNLSSYDFSAVNGFSIAYNKGTQNRPHRFMNRMERTGACTVKVTYKSEHNYSVGDYVFLPNPGIGHYYGEIIYIGHNSGAMVFENIAIRQAPSFIMAVKNNDAEIYFDRVDMMPDENDGRAIHMVSWRDGYHCKDNRYPIHWDRCNVGVLFDDVFNVSNTLGYVTDVDGESAVTVVNYELYTVGQKGGFDARPGDVIDIYSITTGKYCGSASVRRAVSNPNGTTTVIFGYGEKIPGIEKGYVVANRNTCAPGSTITDCHFTGTFRFLRNLRVENCTFDLLAMWIMVEGSVEGPLPGNVDFVNCTFNGGSVQIGALNRNTSQTLSEIEGAITDIGFFGCSFKSRAKITQNRKYKALETDTWSEADLFTVKNARDTVVTCVDLIPTADDFVHTVSYDWTYYGMPVAGAAEKTVKSIGSPDVISALENSDRFSGKVLIPTDNTVRLAGLDATRLPFFHKAGSRYTIEVTLYAAHGGTVSLLQLKDGGSSASSPLACEAGKTVTLAFTYVSNGTADGLALLFDGYDGVIIGNVSVTVADNANPSRAQLQNVHTFEWDGYVTVGDGQAVRISDIADDAVRAAIESAGSGFTKDTVLHLDGGFGQFTGLTDPSFYVQGTTYHLCLDAYIASATVPENGTTVYLIALDGTPGNRVIAEGLFTGEGFWHFETDWTVGAGGEYALTFYMNNTPRKYPDVYIGDFSVSVAKPFRPTVFSARKDYAYPTREELAEGYVFDFTEDKLFDTSVGAYASLSDMDEQVAQKLTACGFGDTVYYAVQNFNLLSIDPLIRGGHSYVITFDVYDVLGNLATVGERGAFVLLNMQGGKQNSAEVHYKVTPDPQNSRHMTLTFTSYPPAGTDDFLLYQLTGIEFVIGGITVREK